MVVNLYPQKSPHILANRPQKGILPNWLFTVINTFELSLKKKITSNIPFRRRSNGEFYEYNPVFDLDTPEVKNVIKKLLNEKKKARRK